MGALDIITGGGITYRVRIFDNGIYLKTVKVPNKGQTHFAATVHAKMMGFGEKTRMEFMINPKIQPKIFGNVFEIDFDIRDAVQLGDLLDINPDLVYEINKNYRLQNSPPEDVQDAEYTVKSTEDLFEDEPKPAEEKKEEPEEEEGTRQIDEIIKQAKTAAEIASVAIPNLPGIRNLTQEKNAEQVKKVLELCTKSPAHRKLLYWVPAVLNIEPEIHMLVSQTWIYQTGISPSYYRAQTDAPIAEKMMTRPEGKKGWQDVAILGLIIVGIIVVCFIFTHKG
jgi:hypothetical protein